MKRTTAILVAAAIASTAGLPAIASGSGPHESHALASHASAAKPALSLDDGRPWATDEALRGHMEAIRARLAQHREAILEGTLGEKDARILGAGIEARVAAILTDCRLEPGADRSLHVIVAQLVQAADVLQGKSKRVPASKGARHAVRAAQMYATYFSHPGWTPVL